MSLYPMTINESRELELWRRVAPMLLSFGSKAAVPRVELALLRQVVWTLISFASSADHEKIVGINKNGRLIVEADSEARVEELRIWRAESSLRTLQKAARVPEVTGIVVSKREAQEQ